MNQKNTYELTYVINAVLGDDQIRGVAKRVHRFIEENGGEILSVDEWGTQRLAYQINKKRNGYYVNLHFHADGDLIARLERAIVLEDDVLRHLVLKLDAKMLRHYENQKTAAKKLAEEQARETAEAARREAEEEDEEEEEEDEDELEPELDEEE